MNIGTRIETDSMGAVEVPAGRVVGRADGAQPALLRHRHQRMPLEVIHAMAWIKWAAAVVNRELAAARRRTRSAIAMAALRVAAGDHDDASSRCRCGRPARARKAT
jgi:fumarate hydratase class II